MKNIKLFEMFLRDGLQSHKSIFPLKDKIHFFNKLNNCNYHCIEFGSTTSPKLIPQMSYSFELAEYINKNKKNNTFYTMLVPSIKSLDNCFLYNIKSFGLVTSISNTFCNKNMRTNVLESFDTTYKMIDKILQNNSNSHIRIYISCSFGCSWEGLTKLHLKNLEILLSNLYIYKLEYDNFDIVLWDIIGICKEETLRNILKLIDTKYIDYFGLHIHTNGNFKNLIDISLQNNISKYDTSLLGIGGCPYTDKSIGNISTIPFIEYIESIGYKTHINLDNLKDFSNKLKFYFKD